MVERVRLKDVSNVRIGPRRVGRSRTNDALENLVSGMGTDRDRIVHTRFTVRELTVDQLTAAYRGDWISRKVVDIPAQDATREWRSWQADEKDITELEKLERALFIPQKLKRALQLGRLYGGAALVLGVDQGKPEEELELDKVGKDDLKFVHVVSRLELHAAELDLDIMSPYYGGPKYYTRSAGAQMKIHPSRVVRIIGNEHPDINASQGWGDPVLQAVADAIMAAGSVTAGVAQLVTEAQTDVVKMPDLTAMVATDEGEARVKDRWALAAMMKSLWRIMLLDSGEDWERVQANFAGTPDILKMYLQIASGAADIPATRMLSQSPGGLNATGDSDTRNYYDRLASEQRTVLTPAITTLDEVLIRSALGSRDESIHYAWNSLWQMTDTEKADLAVKKSQVFKADVDAGLMDQDVLRQARENQLIEDGTYPGLEIILDDAEQAEGLVTEEELAGVEEVDPTDPASVAAAKARGTGKGGVPAEADVQKTALNGAQVTSMVEIATAVAEKMLPPETAIALIQAAFPDLDEDQIKRIIDPLKNFEAKEKPAPAAFGQPPAAGAPARVPPARGAPAQLQAANDKLLEDARPRRLYVSRPVVNAKEIIAWAKANGFATTMKAKDLHVTIMYSMNVVDWTKIKSDNTWGQDEKGRVKIAPGGMRLVDQFGDATVLLFNSSALGYRHEDLKYNGCEWKWDGYQPHITISWAGPRDDLDKLPAYQGEIVLGPELWQEVDENWQEGVIEDAIWKRGE